MDILVDYFPELAFSGELRTTESPTGPSKTLVEGLSKASLTSDLKLYKVGPITLQRANVRSGNGRYYPASVVEKAVEEIQPIVKSMRCIGELDHGNNQEPFPKLKEASHVITSLWFDKPSKTVRGTFVILPTPNGQVLNTLLEAGVSVGVSVRGVGSTTKRLVEGQSVEYVDQFKIITYECVSWAGFNDLTISKEDKKLVSTLTEGLKLSAQDPSQREKLIESLKEVQMCYSGQLPKNPMERLILVAKLLTKRRLLK